jgi:hypothetical protein
MGRFFTYVLVSKSTQETYVGQTEDCIGEFWIDEGSSMAGKPNAATLTMGEFAVSLPHHHSQILSSSAVERSAVNRLVVGSNPTSGAIL